MRMYVTPLLLKCCLSALRFSTLKFLLITELSRLRL